jgi:hypothetical protein
MWTLHLTPTSRHLKIKRLASSTKHLNVASIFLLVIITKKDKDRSAVESPTNSLIQFDPLQTQ